MDKPARNSFYCPNNPKLKMLLLCCLYHRASSTSFSEGGCWWKVWSTVLPQESKPTLRCSTLKMKLSGRKKSSPEKELTLGGFFRGVCEGAVGLGDKWPENLEKFFLEGFFSLLAAGTLSLARAGWVWSCSGVRRAGLLPALCLHGSLFSQGICFPFG